MSGGRAEPVRLSAAGWARTCRPASPAASRSTSTTRDVIKKHERTRRDKEDDRTRHMLRAARADRAGVSRPIAPSPAVDRRGRPTPPTSGRRSSTSPRPTACSTRCGVSTTRDQRALVDGVRRTCRRSTSPTAITARPAPRARGSSFASRAAQPGEWDTFLAVAFPDDQVQILPYNRVVKDLGRSARRTRFLASAASSSSP